MKLATNLRLFVVAAIAGMLSLVMGCDGGMECEYPTDDGMEVCGDFGTHRYTVALQRQDEDAVRWPGAANSEGTFVVARRDDIVRLDSRGNIEPAASRNGQLAAPPSASETGEMYTVRNQNGSVAVTATDRFGDGEERWTTTVADGQAAGTPATVGTGRVHVATRNEEGSTTLFDIDLENGEVLRERPGASPAAAEPSGAIRYLADPTGERDLLNDTPIFGSLVSEREDGTIEWRHAEPAGLVDFAPGGEGETYLVTADRELQKVNDQGDLEWEFTPDCPNCNVAAAPTVTEKAVYFPVWERTDESQPMIDPLYALNKDGGEIWVYDGFDTRRSEINPAGLLTSPGESPETMVRTETTRHHPAGRPVVAQDGTLYVATDGAVVALTPQGEEVGRVVIDNQAGEHSINEQIGEEPVTWIQQGVTPSPVLAEDGTLFIWDGENVLAFDTGRPAAKTDWVAPFGGPSNSGRVQRTPTQ